MNENFIKEEIGYYENYLHSSRTYEKEGHSFIDNDKTLACLCFERAIDNLELAKKHLSNIGRECCYDFEKIKKCFLVDEHNLCYSNLELNIGYKQLELLDYHYKCAKEVVKRELCLRT